MNTKEREENRKFWFNHVALWQKSNLSQMEYCRQNGLKDKNFNHWTRKDKPKQSSTKIIQVPSTQLSVNHTEHDSGINIQVKNLSVKLKKNFCIDTFKRVLNVIE